MKTSCEEACFNGSIIRLKITHNYPPHHLALYNPATCIDTTNTVNNCIAYAVKNVMLGQSIKINACVLSFHNQPAKVVEFVISGESLYHDLSGSQFVSIV